MPWAGKEGGRAGRQRGRQRGLPQLLVMEREEEVKGELERGEASHFITFDFDASCLLSNIFGLFSFILSSYSVCKLYPAQSVLE